MGRSNDIASRSDAGEVVPHIQPDVLYPAVGGKLLDGTTSHSGNYGTAQSDNKKYYYTDIKGSKPIRDPRIGAYFGSQRHKFTSLQLLEQETATHGENVYSIDGREWLRATGPNPTTNHDQQAGAFNSIQFNPSTANDFIEVVGYFNNVNVSVLNLSNSANDVNIYIDGSDTGNDFSTRTTNNGPFFNSQRYVDSGSFLNINVGSLTTPGIHTLKIGGTTTYYYIHGIELIAQDTTSATTRNQIQIPSQDVVSFGTKFTVGGSSAATHYDPFAAKSDGTAWISPQESIPSTYYSAGYTGIYSAGFQGTYLRGFAGIYSAGFTGYYSASYSQGYEGNYSRALDYYSQGFARSAGYDGTYSSGFTGNYAGTYQLYYGSRLAGAYTGYYAGTYSRGFTGAYSGATFYSAGYLRSGGFTGQYSAAYSQGYTGTYSAGYTGNYTTPYTGTYSAGYEGTYSRGFASTAVDSNTPNSDAEWPSHIDTATSLGLEKWVDGQNYYRPYNGARVVKWVNQNGDIKTSVNVMPPNAKSIADSSSLTNATAKTNGSALNDNFRPTFEAHTSDVNEDRLHEAAKTFHFREFGNGGANLGTGGTWADASMLSGSADDIAYVMDDGLTSLSADDVAQTANEPLTFRTSASGDKWFLTFIGTGLTLTTENSIAFGGTDDYDFTIDGVTVKSFQSGSTLEKITTVAQNLPYGTHVFKMSVEGTVQSEHMRSKEFTFHQPKRPPIPEDACVLADYMLMADFVIKGTNEGGNAVDSKFTSKGVRRQESSRDILYNGGDPSIAIDMNGGSGGIFLNTSQSSSAGDRSGTLSAFGTNFSVTGYDMNGRSDLVLNGSTATYTNKNTGNGHGSFHYLTDDTTLGVNNFGVKNKANGRITFAHFEIATPIHTSHHYQSFETPFLHELIGGDRNMEQTHLICSPIGETWDEITRDTSYIGNVNIVASRDGGDFTGSGQAYIYDLFRGEFAAKYGTQKNFAIAYDRFICLVDGYYKITSQKFSANPDRQVQILKNTIADDNGKTIAFGRTDPSDHTIFLTGNTLLKRGDTIAVRFDGATFRGANPHYTFISIEKL